MVVNAAFEIARSSGMEQVMVKNIADKIGCSVQPIYSYCNNMDGLRQDVIEKVNCFIQEYVTNHIDINDLFRSSGHAYIRLAKEEPHLFKIFILHQRSGFPHWMICISLKQIPVSHSLFLKSCTSVWQKQSSCI